MGINPDESGIIIDLNRLSYREYRAFVDAGADADELDILTKVIIAWSFSGDPSERDSYESLGMLDLLAVQKSLRIAITEATTNAGN
ncbi:MAG TPA: hypothetical protein VJZ27_06360 [Aggregatilineales bacterium]|nr:hypothetical protein [Aggregatilineales bacterium]